MTVSQLRDRMTEKVVPEKLMPQNIVEFLMDEDAELPELDAFTFLNRLRSLGIGSADFLYLLSGCGAPAEAVDKVRKNPAMNLQALILTLDGAGLTSQDYTRMLYTARQLWERTLTMRLEDEEQDELSCPETEGTEEFTEELYDIPECSGETEDIADYPAEVPGAEEPAAEEAVSGDGQPAELSEEPHESRESIEEVTEPLQPAVEEADGSTIPDAAVSSGEAEEAGISEDIPDDVPEEAADQPISEETSEFRPIDMEELRRNLLSDAENLSDAADPEEADEEPTERSDDEQSRYHRGALIASAAGAAVLFAAAGCVGLMGFEPVETVSTHFAADSDEIFSAIYESYNSGIIGAEITQWDGNAAVFSDKLAISDGSLGVFYSGGILYTAAPAGIACGRADGAELSDKNVIAPPQDTEFVYAELGGSSLFAVFSGAECGFVRIDGGSVTYTAEQDGVLTDLDITDEKVRLGSVYTPAFSESFSSSQTECFMPSLGTGEKKLISPENILLSGVSGCSYAVSAEYSLADGSAENSVAALGYPLYASCDGSSAMPDGEKGVLIRIEKTEEGYSHTAVHTDRFTAAAGGNSYFAAVGSDENGSFVTIYDGRYQPVSVLRNFGCGITTLGRKGGTVFIGGADGVFMAADCTDAAVPAVISDLINGKIVGNSLLSAEKTDNGAVFTAYTRDGGSCVYTKEVGADAASTLETGGMDTFYSADGVYGAAYSWFDGVSVVSEYAIFGNDSGEVTLFDDKTGFTAAFRRDGKLCLVYGGDKISSDIHA